MSDFSLDTTCHSTMTPKSVESYRDMVNRHKVEAKELDESIKALLKAAKKTDKAQVEARAIQMRFDLRAKQQEEEDSNEEPTGESELLLIGAHSLSVKLLTALLLSNL